MEKTRKYNYRCRHVMVHNYSDYEIQHDAVMFLKAHLFTERLRKHSDVLTMQEYKDLRQQALDGDRKGAEKRLDEILQNKTFRR